MDNQTIFNKVADHLLAQKAKSHISRGTGGPLCAYRGQDGTKCAAGALIADEFYTPKLEGRGVWAPDVHDAICSSLGVMFNSESDTAMLLALLQEVHDEHDPEDWNNKLFDIAERYGFDAAPSMLLHSRT